MGVPVRVTPGGEWARVQRELAARSDGKALRAALSERITREAQPIVAELQSAVRAVPVTSARKGANPRRARSGGGWSPAAAAKRRGGLRDTVARSIRLTIINKGRTQGAVIGLDYSRLPDGQKALPKYLDGRGRWLHPVYGRKPMVEQRGRPWWAPTIRPHLDRFNRAVQSAMDDAIKGISE